MCRLRSFGVDDVFCADPPRFILPFLLLLTFAPLGISQTDAVNQTTQETFNLDFDYNPFSRVGPCRWKFVNVTGNEWERFVGQDHINLDIDGNECKSKRRPSSVNLIANRRCTDNHEILTRRIKKTDCRFDDLTFSFTPHTLRATFPPDDTFCQRPTIDLPNGYPYKWFAHFIEIHIRAEHVLDGRRFDGEIQMVHLGQKDQRREISIVSVLLDATAFEDDPRLQQYIDKWQELADDIERNCNERSRKLKADNLEARRMEERRGMTHDIFQDSNEVGEGNLQRQGVEKNTNRSMINHNQKEIPNMNATETRMPRCALEDEEHRNSIEGPRLMQEMNHTEEEEEVPMAPRRKMFPYDIWPTIYFYRYRGSITTPPCSEIVSWRVLDEPLRITKRQFKHLARLLTSYVDEETCEKGIRLSPTGENYRPLQVLNNEKQILTHCTAEDFTHRLYPPGQV